MLISAKPPPPPPPSFAYCVNHPEVDRAKQRLVASNCPSQNQGEEISRGLKTADELSSSMSIKIGCFEPISCIIEISESRHLSPGAFCGHNKWH